MLCRTFRLMARDRFSRSACERLPPQRSARPHSLRFSLSLVRPSASEDWVTLTINRAISVANGRVCFMASLQADKQMAKDLGFSKVPRPQIAAAAPTLQLRCHGREGATIWMPWGFRSFRKIIQGATPCVGLL